MASIVIAEKDVLDHPMWPTLKTPEAPNPNYIHHDFTLKELTTYMGENVLHPSTIYEEETKRCIGSLNEICNGQHVYTMRPGAWTCSVDDRPGPHFGYA